MYVCVQDGVHEFVIHCLHNVKCWFTFHSILTLVLRTVTFWICNVIYFPLPTVGNSGLTLVLLCVHTHAH